MFYSLSQNGASRPVGRLPWLVAMCTLVRLLAPFFANAQEVHERSLLTTPQIVHAMQDSQLPTRGVQVKLAVAITSAGTNPLLEIQAIAALNSHDLRLRVGCRDRSECLPFFAVASYPEAIDPSTISMKPGRQAAVATRLLTPATPMAETFATSSSSKQLASAEPPLLRSGSPATLDFDGERLHVRVEVICLESGGTGDRIRVATRDRKQVYVAEIVAPNVLKGTFAK